MHSNLVSSWIPALDGVPRLRRFTVPLEEGGKIRSCKLAYATFGQLSPQKDNAILILTWYSGTSKIMEQVYIGPGRAIDPDNAYWVLSQLPSLHLAGLRRRLAR